jgi:hypothetical protein
LQPENLHLALRPLSPPYTMATRLVQTRWSDRSSFQSDLGIFLSSLRCLHSFQNGFDHKDPVGVVERSKQHIEKNRAMRQFVLVRRFVGTGTTCATCPEENTQKSVVALVETWFEPGVAE